MQNKRMYSYIPDIIPQKTSGLLVSLMVIGILLLFVQIAEAVPSEKLSAAFPLVSEVTPGLSIHEQPASKIAGECNSQYCALLYRWDGYLSEDTHEGYLECSIWLYSLDNAFSAQNLVSSESFLSWMKEPGTDQYSDYSGLPGSVWFIDTYQTSDTHYRIKERIAFWIDPHTYGEVEVLGETSPATQSEIESLVPSEAVRLSNLVYGRLTGIEQPTTDFSSTGSQNDMTSPDVAQIEQVKQTLQSPGLSTEELIQRYEVWKEVAIQKRDEYSAELQTIREDIETISLPDLQVQLKNLDAAIRKEEDELAGLDEKYNEEIQLVTAGVPSDTPPGAEIFDDQSLSSYTSQNLDAGSIMDTASGYREVKAIYESLRQNLKYWIEYHTQKKDEVEAQIKRKEILQKRYDELQDYVNTIDLLILDIDSELKKIQTTSAGPT